MKLKKFVTTMTLIALAVGGGISDKTYAMEQNSLTSEIKNYNIISPLWINIDDISPSISANGTTLNPSVYIKAKSSSSSISGTMYLERYDLGRWISVTSWNIKGTSNVFLSKSYIGTSGVKYRTRVVVTVDGETATATSGICET